MIKGEPILILLADADPAHSEAVRRALKASGMNVVIRQAGTLKEFRKIAVAHQPDIAILDLSLPDGRAMDVLTSPPEAGPFPIVVMTSQGNELLALEAMKAGALDYIVKSPEAFADMPRAVARVLREWGVLKERKRAEEKLRESEEKYRAIIETNQEWIWQLNNEGIHTYSNLAIEQILGYSIKDIVGKNAAIYMHPEDRRKIEEMLPLWVENKKGWKNLVVRWLHKDGSMRWLESNAVVMLGVNGELIGFQGSDRDITDRKLAEEELRKSEERYRLISDHISDIVWQLDTGLRFVFVSPAVKRVLGYSIEEALRLHVASFLNEEGKVRMKNVIQSRQNRHESLPVPNEYKMKHKDGHWVDVEVVSSPLFDKDGHPIGFAGIARDISERKRLEEVLKRERRELELMLNTSPIIVFYKDKEGRFLRVNKTFAEALNMHKEDLSGKTVFDIYSPEIAQGMADDDRSILESGRAKVNIIEQYESAGGRRWVQTDKFPILDENGIPVGLIGFAQDITGRMQAEEALRESEEKYRTLFDNANEAIFVVQGGKIVFCNPMTTLLMGYSGEEIRAKSFPEFIHSDDRNMVVERHLKRLKGEEAPPVYSFRTLDREGKTLWIDLRTVLIEWEGQPATLNFANDITERKRAEEALLRAEENYRHTLDDSPVGVCIVTAEGETIYANQTVLDIYGYDSIEELRATPIKNRYTPESYAEFQIRLDKRKQGGESPAEYEISIVRKNGEVRHLLVFRKEVLWNGERQYQALYRDITERKRMELALWENEKKYRALFDNAGEAIFVAQGGKLVFSNPMTSRLLGHSSEEIRTRPFTDFIHPEDRNMVVERHLKRLRGEEVPPVYSFRIINRDGNTRWIDLRAVLITWEGKPATLNFVSDITERKRTEEELRRSEERHRMLFETMAQGVVYQDADGTIISANSAAERILGLSLDQMRGRTSVDPRWRAIHEDRSAYPGETHPSMVALRTGKEVQGIMGVFNPKKESCMWISINAVPQFRPGESQPYQVYTTFADITDRKQAEEVIRTSLREKEVLLREIHHRVKNNMQVISSLFNLQAGYIKDEEALRILKEGQTRIRSMALVHEKLYKSGDLSKIDLAGYIQSLLAHLFHTYLVDPNQVRLETELEDVPLDINTAMPCGLILNELISNALKHAFPAGKKGVLLIRLRRGKNGAVELRIADNGVGFPKGLDFRHTDSLGMQIVNLLVAQIEGTIKLVVKNGTVFSVAFPETKQELTKN